MGLDRLAELGSVRTGMFSDRRMHLTNVPGDWVCTDRTPAGKERVATRKNVPEAMAQFQKNLNSHQSISISTS